MSTVENPPAFPAFTPGSLSEHPGMSLRDWFAGQALAGMLASEAGIQAYPHDWAAERAFLLADAMLQHRKD